MIKVLLLLSTTALLMACHQTPDDIARNEQFVRDHEQDLQAKINQKSKLTGCTVSIVDYLTIVRCQKSETTTTYMAGKVRRTVVTSDET